MNNDTLDHIVTGVLALTCIVGAIIIQLYSNATPDWLIAIAGAASGFYFRGRTNGQFNASKMSKLEQITKEIKATAANGGGSESGTRES